MIKNRFDDCSKRHGMLPMLGFPMHCHEASGVIMVAGGETLVFRWIPTQWWRRICWTFTRLWSEKMTWWHRMTPWHQVSLGQLLGFKQLLGRWYGNFWSLSFGQLRFIQLVAGAFGATATALAMPWTTRSLCPLSMWLANPQNCECGKTSPKAYSWAILRVVITLPNSRLFVKFCQVQFCLFFWDWFVVPTCSRCCFSHFIDTGVADSTTVLFSMPLTGSPPSQFIALNLYGFPVWRGKNFDKFLSSFFLLPMSFLCSQYWPVPLSLSVLSVSPF